MPNILVNRLFLNLKTFDDPDEGLSTSSLPPPVFAQDRWLGNIGAPLDSQQWEHNEDLEGEGGPSDTVMSIGVADALTTFIPVVSRSQHLERLGHC